MEEARKPEFHLYLFSFDGFKKDIINANTISECEERGRMHKDIDTSKSTRLYRNYTWYMRRFRWT